MPIDLKDSIAALAAKTADGSLQWRRTGPRQYAATAAKDGKPSALVSLFPNRGPKAAHSHVLKIAAPRGVAGVPDCTATGADVDALAAAAASQVDGRTETFLRDALG